MWQNALCKHSNAAGAPGEGFHALRIPMINLAMWDVVGTFLIAAIIGYVSNSNTWLIALMLFVLATILHLVFCSSFILGLFTLEKSLLLCKNNHNTSIDCPLRKVNT